MKLIHTASFGSNNSRALFFLAGWKNRLWMFFPVAFVLQFFGFYVLVYAYDDAIFSPNVTKTVANIHEVSANVLEKIHMLQQDGYRDFSIFGTSLGAVIALIVANKSTVVSKIVLNTIGYDVATAVWTWDAVIPRFKDSLVNQNYTLTTLQKAWHTIAPINNIDHLKEKKVLILLAKHDEMIPYYLGEELVHALRKHRVQHSVSVNTSLNHFFTGVYNILNIHSYIYFLKEN